MSNFKVKFRGVRGSFPVADKKFLKYGGNTACVEINAGGHTIILDAGTGIVNVGNELVSEYISSGLNPEERKPICTSVLLSHIHQDHLLGLTFFTPMHIKSAKIQVFGAGGENSDLQKNLSDLVFGKTFPIDLGDIACSFEINNISDEYVIWYKKDEAPCLVLKSDLSASEDDVVVSFYKSYVHPQDGVIIYKVSYKGKSVVYATDKECYFGGDKKFVQFAKNCDLLIHDSQYTSEDYLNLHSPKQGYGHPSYNDEILDRIKELYTTGNKNIIMSYEGMEFDVE